MSHLLCLNSCNNYPNKCPHICLHLVVKYLLTARGRIRSGGLPLTEEAHYTDRSTPCKRFRINILTFYRNDQIVLNYESGEKCQRAHHAHVKLYRIR